jgi:hypothetical protein
MGSKFGVNPTVRTKISVKHGGQVLQEEKIEHIIWYNATQDPRTRVESTSTHAGYQYNNYDSPLTIKEALFPYSVAESTIMSRRSEHDPA